MHEFSLAPYAPELALIQVNLRNIELRFPTNLEKDIIREPEGKILSIRRRLRKFFEHNETSEEPFRNILGYIKRTKSRIVYLKDLLPEQYYDNPTAQKHICRDQIVEDDVCRKLISDFSMLIIETGIGYPFVKDLEDHPEDAFQIGQMATEWALHKKDVPKLRLMHTMARFVAHEIVIHPQIFESNAKEKTTPGKDLLHPRTAI